MKFTKIRLIGLFTIDLPIIGALPSDRYICRTVDGLDTPGVDVFISKNVTSGGFYQGRRPQNRQIIAQIGLNPSYTAGELYFDLRAELYGLLSTTSDDRIQIQLLDGEDVVLVTYGWVSKLENVIFSKEQIVQLTIDCDRPYLEAPEVHEVTLPIPSTNFTIPNIGSAPTGMTMKAHVTSPGSTLAGFHLYFNGKSFVVQADSYGLFRTDMILTIETEAGKRSVSVYEPSPFNRTTNYLWALHGDSDWPQLNPGNNFFTTDDSDKFEWESISYTPKYWGV